MSPQVSFFKQRERERKKKKREKKLTGRFCGGATFEMRELNTEKCIFRLIMIAAAQRLINGRR